MRFGQRSDIEKNKGGIQGCNIRQTIHSLITNNCLNFVLCATLAN
ncbi:MAG: hypothetical protein ACTS8R_01870 [Arsenophonus sp. NC-QC1-MAG3]